jgi:hypothetical protein
MQFKGLTKWVKNYALVKALAKPSGYNYYLCVYVDEINIP